MALDWPLSREEKKGRLMSLYDLDLRALDGARRSDEAKIRALHEELRTARRKSCPEQTMSRNCAGSPEISNIVGRAVAEQLLPKQQPCASEQRGRPDGFASLTAPHDQETKYPEEDFASEAVEHFRQAIASAADAIGSLLAGSGVREHEMDAEQGLDGQKLRARSEGANRDKTMPSALRKPNSRRNSRGGPRVSFGDTPEEVHEQEPEPMGEPEPTPLPVETHGHVLSDARCPAEQTVDEYTSGHASSCDNRVHGCDGFRGCQATLKEQLHAPCFVSISLPSEQNHPEAIEAQVNTQRRGRRRARLHERLHGYAMSDLLIDRQ